jgi:hypothetical protein
MARWADRVFALVVACYPRTVRKEYAAAMKLLLHDMLEDPGTPKRRVWTAVLNDAANLVGGLRFGALQGAFFGVLVVLTWYVGRSDVLPLDVSVGLALISALFVAAGFVGARRSGTLAGGIWVGLFAGLISTITVPGDYLFFHNFPFYDLMSFALTMAISAAVVMFYVILGALLPSLPRYGHRVVRSIGAFAGAWREDPS